MDFELDNIGTVSISEEYLTITCDFKISAKEFAPIGGEGYLKLEEDSREILNQAIDGKSAVKLSNFQRMNLSAFFMTLSVELSEIERKKMRICGAAHFFPPKQNSDDQ